MENTTPQTPVYSDNSMGEMESSPLHQLDLSQKGPKPMQKSLKLPIIAAVIAIAAGVTTGWGGAKLQGKTSSTSDSPSGPIQQVAGTTVKAGDVFGVADEKTFKDSAEGYLEIGGVDGEGSHKLLRAGGVSQTVYLTSSITDLDKFQGMTVKVWGETYKGQKAGWLMDVGRVQIINPKGQAPIEE